jgi:hypothetical protein
MTKLAIQVLMYPHDSKPSSFQQFSWHRPANIRLQLTPAGGGRPVDLVTGSKGVARGNVPDDDYTVGLPDLTSLAGGQDFFYLLSLPAARIAKPAVPANIEVRGVPKTAELHLFPDNGNWLVPLWLKIGSAGVADAKVEVTDAGGAKSFTSLSDGHVFATASAGDVTVQPDVFPNLAPVPAEFIMRVGQEQESVKVEYRPRRARITVTPRLKSGEAIPGVTFQLSGPGQAKPLSQVSQGSQACVFDDLMPNQVTVKVIPPTQFNGSPIVLIGRTDCVSVSLAAGDDLDLSQRFRFKYTTGSISGRVVNGEGKPISGISIVATSNGQSKSTMSGKNGRYSIRKLRAGQWTIMLAQSTVRYGSETLFTQQGPQDLTVQAGKTTKATDFKLEPDEHGIRGQVTDSNGLPYPNAIVEIRDQRMRVIDTVVTDDQGNYSWQSPSSGMFVVNLLTRDGRTVQREAVTINSWTPVNMRAPDSRDGSGPQSMGPNGSGIDQSGRGAPSAGSAVREAVTDLAAYPVLTEEVSTTGVPAPVAGGRGGGGAGAGYGQAVDQAIRDVLGWRPGGDVAGFQAALTGAFQLRNVEGHTEWTWQQRGYAVQADMGALTGAQASIYARAKSALDQLLPLLAGLTSLNPALWPEQDREAIRTVVTTELQELVGELALEGGPRIQRVDELLGLLLGDSIGSTNLNPDIVQGQLGMLRERFALTADWIETVDDERVATNFRIVVEQILALQASWSSDRVLLSGVDSRTALGTVLIWLSRGLEAVCESVSDLTFALDSVYIDAAQRQVIELTFGPGQPPLLLSDLLDWIVRATGDEGPRLIQDAGRDGVRAFAPVLDRLRGLVVQTIQAVKNPALPPGLQTPRVTRALQVLRDQLGEATRLAGLVQLGQAPIITTATASTDDCTGLSTVTLGGANFRNPASAVLLVADREDVPDVPARYANASGTTAATATFRIPRHGPNTGRVSWEIVFINGDGTQSYPPFPIQIPR